MSDGARSTAPGRSITYLKNLHFAGADSLIAKKVLDDIRFDITDEKTIVGITTMQGDSNTTEIAEDHSISHIPIAEDVIDRLIIHFEPHVFTCQRTAGKSEQKPNFRPAERG